jgi:hypothetical protein
MKEVFNVHATLKPTNNGLMQAIAYKEFKQLYDSMLSKYGNECKDMPNDKLLELAIPFELPKYIKELANSTLAYSKKQEKYIKNRLLTRLANIVASTRKGQRIKRI